MYVPSNSIKQQIIKWEGSSMRTNRSFELEAKDFENALKQAGILQLMTQDELDPLFSLSYNIGIGNFKKRVLPSLIKLYTGSGKVEDVTKNMYEKKDSDPKLPGLKTRRNKEKKLFVQAYEKNHKNLNVLVQNTKTPTDTQYTKDEENYSNIPQDNNYQENYTHLKQQYLEPLYTWNPFEILSYNDPYYVKNGRKLIKRGQYGMKVISNQNNPYNVEIYLEKDGDEQESPHKELQSWQPDISPEERMDQTTQQLNERLSTYKPTKEQKQASEGIKHEQHWWDYLSTLPIVLPVAGVTVATAPEWGPAALATTSNPAFWGELIKGTGAYIAADAASKGLTGKGIGAHVNNVIGLEEDHPVGELLGITGTSSLRRPLEKAGIAAYKGLRGAVQPEYALSQAMDQALWKPYISRVVGENGKIRLRLPGHTDEIPSELVVVPRGNNQFEVHIRTQEGSLSQWQIGQLYEALYNELPEGAEILFPESGPGYYAKRGTVAALQRLARDPRYTAGKPGVLLYDAGKNGENTIRLYRATGTSGEYTPSLDGTKEFSGQWFTTDPRKAQRFASMTTKRANMAHTENPIELQYVDIPESELEAFKAENILKGRTDIEYEPTEDYLIPLNFPRARVQLSGYSGNILKDIRLPLPELQEQSNNLGLFRGTSFIKTPNYGKTIYGSDITPNQTLNQNIPSWTPISKNYNAHSNDYVTIESNKHGPVFTLKNSNGETLGDLALMKEKNGVFSVSNINSYKPGGSGPLYNAAIRYGQLRYGDAFKGIRSGDLLASAEQTTNVTNKFPAEQLPYKGAHFYGNEYRKGPVLLLTGQSSYYPTPNMPLIERLKTQLPIPERFGIPKGERNNLTQDQTEALSDLYQYITSGRHRQHFMYTPENTLLWGNKTSGVPLVRKLTEEGASASGSNLWFRVGWNGEGRLTYSPVLNRSAWYQAKGFPKIEGVKYNLGEATMSEDGTNTYSLKLTSPRVDVDLDLEGIREVNPDLYQAFIQLPTTIPKEAMRGFWRNTTMIQRPGTYLTGDSGLPPIGNNLIQTYNKDRLLGIYPDLTPLSVRAINRTGLSPDSYAALIRQGLRNPAYDLRWGEGFTEWNPSAVYNSNIYDAWNNWKLGKISLKEYKTIFDQWAKEIGGRPLQILKLNGKDAPLHPHPYIYKRKRGGKIN